MILTIRIYNVSVNEDVDFDVNPVERINFNPFIHTLHTRTSVLH